MPLAVCSGGLQNWILPPPTHPLSPLFHVDRILTRFTENSRTQREKHTFFFFFLRPQDEGLVLGSFPPAATNLTQGTTNSVPQWPPANFSHLTWLKKKRNVFRTVWEASVQTEFLSCDCTAQHWSVHNLFLFVISFFFFWSRFPPSFCERQRGEQPTRNNFSRRWLLVLDGDLNTRRARSTQPSSDQWDGFWFDFCHQLLRQRN